MSNRLLNLGYITNKKNNTEFYISGVTKNGSYTGAGIPGWSTAGVMTYHRSRMEQEQTPCTSALDILLPSTECKKKKKKGTDYNS